MPNRRNRTRSHNSKPYTPRPTHYDPHLYEKYISVGFTRADVVTSWRRDKPAATIGLYYPQIYSDLDNIPLHPGVNNLPELLAAIVARAATKLTRDDQDVFVATHARQFICYGYQVVSEHEVREYWAEFRYVSFDNSGIFRANLLVHQATVLYNQGPARVGQVRKVTELLRNEFGHPYAYATA